MFEIARRVDGCESSGRCSERGDCVGHDNAVAICGVEEDAIGERTERDNFVLV